MNILSKMCKFYLFSFAVIIINSASISAPPDFSWPVKIPIRLSGTFGELRSNHFHAGIDIKSPNGGSGTPIYAAADGFIHRVKVKPGGYGNALYIKHHGGYSTVYAHLDKFLPEMSQYIRKAQYSKNSFTVNLFPSSSAFPVKKGDLIAFMGNSGHSYGPHLHFEIRSNGVPVNALDFLKFKDNQKPIIKNIVINNLNHHSISTSQQIFPLKKIMGDTIIVNSDKIGISSLLYDPHNQGTNKNGIYQLILKQDGKIVFHSTYTKCPFNKTRYANACMNYRLKKSHNMLAYNLYKLPGNKFDNYKTLVNNGNIQIEEKTINLEIIAIDQAGNEARINFFIKKKGSINYVATTFNYLLEYDQAKIINWNDVEISIPANTLYNTCYLNIDKRGEHYLIGSDEVPLHKYINLKFSQNEGITDKSFIAFCGKKGKVYNVGGTMSNDKLKASVRSFGEYYIEVDSVPPEIKQESWAQHGRTIKAVFGISDNYTTIGKAKGLKVLATLDGKWTLLKEESKKASWFWEEKLSVGKHLLKICVTDDRMNETEFINEFEIK